MTLAHRLSCAVYRSNEPWLIVLRWDAWLTLMLQVDDGREPMSVFMGIPIHVVHESEEEFIVCES